MKTILILIGIFVTILILYRLFFKKEKTEKPVAYVCDQCGEVHCDCHPKDQTTD
jgi:hypothetical protein